MAVVIVTREFRNESVSKHDGVQKFVNELVYESGFTRKTHTERYQVKCQCPACGYSYGLDLAEVYQYEICPICGYLAKIEAFQQYQSTKAVKHDRR